MRVLVYGQSISEQTWWLDVRAWLVRQYPHGTLVMDEHARGGCPAQCLIGREAWFQDGETYNRLPEDVFAFRPDLVIFSVYGRHDDYATLVRGMLEGCDAFADHPVLSARCAGSGLYPDYRAPEVLLQTYHRVDDLEREALPFQPPVRETDWDAWMARVWIPHVAEAHGLPVVDVWTPWQSYLQGHGLRGSDLLEDAVHLNDEGNALFARLTESALCHVPSR